MNKVKKRPNQKQSRRQPRKDDKVKRVNFDNTREDKFEHDIKKDMTSKCNDPSWYANSPELMKSAASIPFSAVVGDRPQAPHVHKAVPGVLSIWWTPYVGGRTSAVNQAANSIYSYTVHANSRTQVYDAPDEMMLILAGANVFSAIAMGVRAYGVMTKFSQIDRYTPDALLTAMGFDPSDLRSNYSKMWFDLNQVIAMSRQIWIPNTMPFIERWFWLNSNVYKDGDSAKSQYYVFTPQVLFQYNESGGPGGSGALSPKNWVAANTVEPLPLNTWSGYMSLVTGMINALLNSQDRGIIFGDILKAYGSDRLYSISDIAANYSVEPVYDREVLSQIENATIYPNEFLFEDNGTLGIYQNPTSGGIYQGLRVLNTASAADVFYSDCKGAPDVLTLNFHQREVPSAEQIMVATRLMSAGDKIVATKQVTGTGTNFNAYLLGPAVAGTEVITACCIFYYEWNTGEPVLSQLQYHTHFWFERKWEDRGVTLSFGDVRMWAAFDWCPRMLSSSWESTPLSKPGTGQGVYRQLISETLENDYYTYITAQNLEMLHTTAIYSEFGVPAVI